MEPFKMKLRRWFLGEDNAMSESISETLYYNDEVSLKTETVQVLSELFSQADVKLPNGVTRKLLAKTFSKMGVFAEKKEKEEFYFESPYRKKVIYL
jgi:hypothetical protein